MLILLQTLNKYSFIAEFIYIVDRNMTWDCIIHALTSAKREFRGKSMNWRVHLYKKENRHGHKISTWLELYESTYRIYGLYSTRTITQHITIFRVGCKRLPRSKLTIIYGRFGGILRSRISPSHRRQQATLQNLIKKKERKREKEKY